MTRIVAICEYFNLNSKFKPDFEPSFAAMC